MSFVTIPCCKNKCLLRVLKRCVDGFYIKEQNKIFFTTNLYYKQQFRSKIDK